MAGKKSKIFNILTPDVRTIYLGDGHKQKARYLQLHDGFGRSQLDEDIAAGASIYESFTKTLTLKGTKYNLITAPSEEDGLRAVAYLAGIHAREMEYEDCDLIDEYKDDEEHNREVDLFELDDLADFEDLEDDSLDFFHEDFGRIPLIDMYEVMAEEGQDKANNGFGMFNMQLQNNVNKIEPWWKDCTQKSVCIIKGQSLGFMCSNELLSPQEIEGLKRFSENDQVYVLVIDRSIREDDFSITTAVLEFTANHFRVEDNRKNVTGYYRRLLECVASRYGFSFAKSLDIELLTDKLSMIDKQFPCREFEKIMEYLKHLGAPKRLNSASFDSMGLKKLIEKVTASDISGTLDSELIGMKSVKQQVSEIINMLRYVKLRSSKGIKMSEYHNVHLFIGAPGTAKTKVAKMMAQMMQNEGLISGNRFISVTGAELKGAFVGQTAPKIHALFDQYDAIFIDEAYSLACGSEFEGGLDSYSQEGLAQLAVELEEHATDKLVIFAGYGGKNVSKKNNLMNKFLKSNPGISSRINSTVYFDSYTPEDMVDIVHHLAKLSSLELSKERDEDVAGYFKTRQNEEDFGNGREARMFIEQCQRFVAQRVSGKDEDKIGLKELNTVTADDIGRTIDVLKEKKRNELGQNVRAYGFV